MARKDTTKMSDAQDIAQTPQTPQQTPQTTPVATVVTAVDSAPEVQHVPPVVQPVSQQHTAGFAQQCVLCGGTLPQHFNASGEWSGCTKTERGVSFFLPPMLLSVTPTAQHAGITLTTPRRASAARAALHVPSSKRHARAAAHDAPLRRGRVPGAYRTTEKDPDKIDMTDSMRKVYHALKPMKRGLPARALAARLAMPMGTVGWVLTRLQQRGAIARIAK